MWVVGFIKAPFLPTLLLKMGIICLATKEEQIVNMTSGLKTIRTERELQFLLLRIVPAY